MRACVVLLCTLLSCGVPHKQIEHQANTIPPKESVPTQDERVIRTRVIVETATFTTGEHTVMMYGASAVNIEQEISNCEEVFEDLGIKFDIVEISFRTYNPQLQLCFLDASRYKDTLSVYYILPHNFPFSGLSSAPWEELSHGIIMSGSRDEWTLAHEFGHYLGLLHTFDPSKKEGDFCEDTPEQIMKKTEICRIEGQTTNCGNIMNYCTHCPKFLTDCQKKRANRFLQDFRTSHIICDRNRVKQQLEVLYNVILELSIMRYEPPTTQSISQPSQTLQPSI